MPLSLLLPWFGRLKSDFDPSAWAGEGLFSSTFEQADVGLAHIGLDGKIVRANACLRALLGYSQAEIVGLDKIALVRPQDRWAFAQDFAALRSGLAESHGSERVYLAKSGKIMRAWTHLRRIGDLPCVLLVVENIAARQAAEAALRVSEERFELAMLGADEGLFDWGIQEKKTYLSPRWKSMLGYADDEIADDPDTWRRIAGPGVQETIAESIRRLEARETQTYEIEIKLRHKDGRWLDILSRGFPVFDADHRVVRLVGTHQDITERKRQEAELRLSSAVFDNTNEGILIADISGQVQAVNPAFEFLFGYRAEDIRGRSASFLRSGRHDDIFYENFYRDIKSVGRWRGEVWNRRKDGLVQPYWTTVSAFYDEAGDPAGFVALYTDISESKQSQAQLDFLIHHDAATELPNRLSLRERIDALLPQLDETAAGAALFHFELDRYRMIVESLGHRAGVELLTQSSRRFLASLGARDMIARIGSGGLAILVQDCPDEEAARARAGVWMAEMESPFVFGSGATAYSGVNIGLVLFASGANDADTLMRQAESALHAAREAGGGLRLYEPRHMIEARERLELETGLRLALERDEFVLQFQPLVELDGRRVFGVEALVRWRTPEGYAPPGRFIPLAEKTGLIVQIGEWVLRRAAERMKAWLDDGIDLDVLSINISPRQFERPDLADRIAAVLSEIGLPFEKLEIEITESVLMDQKDAVLKIEELRALGLRVSVDDFGTGHSSLAYLKNFPIHKLKLDRAFIKDVPLDCAGMEIAASVIRLGHSLAVEVLAEGVETEAQAEFLVRSGCRFAQGYLFGRPMWEDDLIAWLRSAQRAAA